MAKPEFTPATGKTILLKIEAVFELNDNGFSDEDDLLDSLRSYGAAEIVERCLIAEDFNAASTILSRRASKR